jgi:hypothetical protein
MLDHTLIAFTGFSRAGKDTAARPLIAAGYARHNFGDIIKRQLDPLVREHFGFSAFTERTLEKTAIRRTLEMWGEDNYDRILAEFLTTLPDRAVNTKVMRLREARAWTERGGIIVEIRRPGLTAFGSFERECIAELHSAGLISHTIWNWGTEDDLAKQVLLSLRPDLLPPDELLKFSGLRDAADMRVETAVV